MNILPDSETLALEIARHYVPEMQFGVTPLENWDDKLPFGVIARVGGKSPDPRYVDQALLSVMVFAETRKQASDLARKVQAAFLQAYQDQYLTSVGHISWFQVTKGPVPVRDGLSGKHANTWMFDATYTVWVRA
jgi:hypothetical protein